MTKKSALQILGIILIFILGLLVISYIFTLIVQTKSGTQLFEIDTTFSIKKIYHDVTDVIENDSAGKKVYLGMICALGLVLLLFSFNHNLNLSRYDKNAPKRVENGEHGNARMLSGNDIRYVLDSWNTEKKPKNIGTVYGMTKTIKAEKIWTNNDDIHILCVGTTRAGKSRRILLPTIWAKAQVGESMIITDPKGELQIYTSEYLRNKGYKIVTINLRDVETSNTFNPMERVNKEIVDYIEYLKKNIKEGNKDKIEENKNKALKHMSNAMKSADEVAHALVLQNMKGSSPNDPFWVDMAKAVVASVILYVSVEAEKYEVKNLATVRHIIGKYGATDNEGYSALYARMESLDDEHPAKIVWETVNLAEGRTRVGIFSQAMQILQIFAQPVVRQLTSVQDHNMNDVVEKPTATFLIIPDESPIYNIISTLYIDQLYQNTVEIINKKGNRAERNIAFLLDEFGNLPKIPNFETKLTIAGGRGLLFTLLVQDLQQLKAIYNDGMKTIGGNCHTTIYLKSSDLHTAEEISKKLGKYTILKESQGSSMSGSIFDKTQTTSSVNYSTAAKDILDVEQILRWDNTIDGVIVMQTGKHSCVVPAPDLSEYKANKDFGLGDKDYNTKLIVERRRNESLNGTQKKMPRFWSGIGWDDEDYEDYEEDYEKKEEAIKDETTKKAKKKSAIKNLY